MSLKIIQEGQLNIFVSSDVVLTQGQLVKYDNANPGKVIPAGAGEAIAGIVAQHVQSGNVDNFKLDSVTHIAKIGDKVGVYYGEGQYYTDQYDGTVNVGAPLYAGTGGKLSPTASGNVVAYAETAGVSGNTNIRIRTV